ncbi:unnamed protein product [Ectocarpus sp. CCAP 1310/34]|nr:unnamed protein product [Ectocarpus sp. CCAP 1310/34]
MRVSQKGGLARLGLRCQEWCRGG